MMALIFEQSRLGEGKHHQLPEVDASLDIPTALLRTQRPALPDVNELQVVRHFTNLSRKNFAIDTHFYPLGSCTMKYNPRAAHECASLPGFLQRHPYAPVAYSQGYMACLFELQEIIKEATGMTGVSLACLAGAQGEFAGIAMIKAYHRHRGDDKRTEIIVPDAAHGTNPATAVMCGYQVREIPTTVDGDINLEALAEVLSEHTAGIMLTNPSTLGVFERKIKILADMVHEKGALLYYDGANLNAILGKVRPGDMGFDVMHLNLHKTFATPHGGGGPGSGPIACNDRLRPFLPIPYVAKHTDESYRWLENVDCPLSIGRLTTFAGNAGINLRAFVYARLLGRQGMHRVAEYATLNANYLMARLKKAGFSLAYPARRASHEFIVTFKAEAKTHHITAMDIAKRLLDYGFHAPTTYFPLLVPECFLIEPTETESKETLDKFADTLIKILQEVRDQPELVRQAPHTLPVTRLDDVKAARELDIAWKPHRMDSHETITNGTRS